MVSALLGLGSWLLPKILSTIGGGKGSGIVSTIGNIAKSVVPLGQKLLGGGLGGLWSKAKSFLGMGDEEPLAKEIPEEQKITSGANGEPEKIVEEEQAAIPRRQMAAAGGEEEQYIPQRRPKRRRRVKMPPPEKKVKRYIQEEAPEEQILEKNPYYQSSKYEYEKE